jgi:hypothetical protein
METVTNPREDPTTSETIPSRLLFSYMVETFVAKGVTTYAVAEPFRKITPQKPFLWIPGRPSGMSLGKLMGLVEVGGMKGCSFLLECLCADIVTAPAEPYFMFDIEDGGAHLNTRPSLSEARIVAEGRSPYTILEGIFHAMVFPEVFEVFNLNLCGSRYKGDNMPELLLGKNGLHLQSDFMDYPQPNWGAPSCKRRYTAHDLGLY